MTTLNTRPSSLDELIPKVRLAPVNCDGVVLEQFTVSEQAAKFESLRSMINGGRGTRAVRAGTYTRLRVDGVLWMTDTHSERWDHYDVVRRAADPSTRRVLINGLGLGMVLNAILRFDHIEHVDVVEIDGRIIRHIGRQYDDPRVTFHQKDAELIQWPPGTRWDIVYSDIWATVSTENWDSMKTMRRKYQSRADYVEEWKYEWVRGEVRRIARGERWW